METNAVFENEEVKKEITVSWSKMTDGIGLVFAGVMSMLEALDAGAARDIMTASKMENNSETRENDAAEDVAAGAVDDHAGADDDAATDPAGDAVKAVNAAAKPEKKQTAPKDEPTPKDVAAPKDEPNPKDEPAPAVTQDDITKIIVQKLKKDRTNNEKIGAILKTYGVTKVSELPAAKYEAFLTDLSQL